MENFTQVSNEILTMDLSSGALKLYMNLLKRCFGDKHTCFPSEKTLAEEIKKSVRTVQRYLKELVNKGLIIIKRRGSISNLYTIVEKVNRLIEKKTNKKVNELKEKCLNSDTDSNAVESEDTGEGEFGDERKKHVEDEIAASVERKVKGYNCAKNNKNYKSNYHNKNYYSNFYHNKSSKKESIFNSFEQRNYDFEKLEAALLGWDKSITYEDCLRSGENGEHRDA